MTTIYAIRQISKNKYYIGSTIRYRIRKQQHIYALKHNRHHSPKLQNAWNKYKINDFEFIILYQKPLNEKSRLKIEQKFIKKYNSYYDGFNCRKYTTKLAHVSKAEKHYHSRKIVSYNIDNGEIKYYNSISEVEKDDISQYNVSTCCRELICRVKNFFFFYKEKFNLENLKSRFIRYNTHANTGKIRSNITKNKISQTLKGRKLSGEHIKNITKNIPRGASHPSARKIIRNDGKIYHMIQDAANDIGVKRTSISQHLSGRSKSTGGYIFQYL